jgi:hypothetical protein
MKPPEVERVTRKPGEIELNREPRETKIKPGFETQERERAKKTDAERGEQSTLRLYTRNTTQQNSGQKAKKYSENTAHFRRLANGTGDWTKTPKKNLKIKMVGVLTISNVIQKSKWKQTTPRELDSHLLL